MAENGYTETYEIISLASRLNSLLKEKKIQKKEFYDFCPQNNLTRWCNEKNPPRLANIRNKAIQQLGRIAETLDVDLEYLLCKQVEKRGGDVKQNRMDVESVWKSFQVFTLEESLNSFLSLVGNYQIRFEPYGTEFKTETFKEIEAMDGCRFKLVTKTCKVAVKGAYKVSLSRIQNGDEVSDADTANEWQFVTEKVIEEDEFNRFFQSLKGHVKCELDLLLGTDAKTSTHIDRHERKKN